MTVSLSDVAGVCQAALAAAWPDGAQAAVVAVSGGPDSLALALMAADWAWGRGIAVTALTVDHGLRPGAADEARQVGGWLAAHGIPHQVLRWDGPKPASNIQAAARAARYRLLTDWCRAHGVPVLLLGHQADDQIETFLLRLGRGSGLKGLAAMRPVTERGGVRLLRPLLEVHKAELRAFLTARGQPWLEDPSNHDRRFSRSPVRALAARLPEAGIPAARVLLAVRNLQRASDAIDTLVAERLRQEAVLHPAGYATLSPAVFDGPDELALRALATLLEQVSGRAPGGRLAALIGGLAALRQPEPFRLTLWGCCLSRDLTGKIQIWREARAVAPRQPARPALVWDNRFMLCCKGDVQGLDIGALGDDGWRQIRADGAGPCTLPHPVRLTLPALWRAETVLAVPLPGWARPGWEGRCTAVFTPLADPTISNDPELTYI